MEENASLKIFNTFKIGGPARYFFRVKNLDEARQALGFARRINLPFFVLGGGSNILVSDSGFMGVVIKNELFGVSFEDKADNCVETIVGAGEPWDKFVAETVRRGLFGLENLSGIPGTVGGAPVQNIGAYGAEVKDSIVSVEALHSETGELKTFNNTDCHFAYRDSFFKTLEGKRHIITAVRFRLKKASKFNLEYRDLKKHFGEAAAVPPTLETVRQAVLEIRRGKFPDLEVFGTAGSFFKNPVVSRRQFDELKKKYPDLPGFPLSNVTGQMSTVKIPLAWILDNVCGLKGYQKGNVSLFKNQPIVLVNNGFASAKEVMTLALEVSTRVKEKTGIDVEREVEYL